MPQPVGKTFAFGDHVRHAECPEWGIGTVTAVQLAAVNGKAGQRLTIRFPNAGVKTINTAVAVLEPVHVNGTSDHHEDEPPTIETWDRMRESGEWLAPIAEQKIEEQMISLPIAVRDKFNSVTERLRATIRLYKYDRSSKGLIDWAVAQTGLEDPLSRFTRPELEQRFDRWSHERDQHLRALVNEARQEHVALEPLMVDAPKPAADALRRVTAGR